MFLSICLPLCQTVYLTVKALNLIKSDLLVFIIVPVEFICCYCLKITILNNVMLEAQIRSNFVLQDLREVVNSLDLCFQLR